MLKRCLKTLDFRRLSALARDLLMDACREWFAGKDIQRKGNDKMNRNETEQAQGTGEVTLEGWRAERRQMEAEMAADSAQLKAAMEEALANDDLPPEMKKVIRESGTKLLELDDWLREMYDSAEETIKRCDEMIAKADALEAQGSGRPKTTKLRLKRETQAMTTERQ